MGGTQSQFCSQLIFRPSPSSQLGDYIFAFLLKFGCCLEGPKVCLYPFCEEP